MWNSILEKVICHRIPIQTLSFLTALPARQGGFENRYNVYVGISYFIPSTNFREFVALVEMRCWEKYVAREYVLND